mmetsp:Transcript_9896/g.31254  ORF Transcript_9896/g.31254 Transcript_9896/m.31254 type:complete len:206 (+) Transcript_9896:235-852(+)
MQLRGAGRCLGEVRGLGHELVCHRLHHALPPALLCPVDLDEVAVLCKSDGARAVHVSCLEKLLLFVRVRTHPAVEHRASKLLDVKLPRFVLVEVLERGCEAFPLFRRERREGRFRSRRLLLCAGRSDSHAHRLLVLERAVRRLRQLLQAREAPPLRLVVLSFRDAVGEQVRSDLARLERHAAAVSARMRAKPPTLSADRQRVLGK